MSPPTWSRPDTVDTPSTIRVLGGPTTLIRLAGWTLLTDPTFDAAGSEYQDGPVRLRKTADPATPAGDLPALDAVLVSHTQHRDNLDTAGRLVAVGAPLVLTTPAGAQELGGPAEGLAPWQTRTLSAPGRPTLTVTAVPGRHGPAGTEAVTGPVTGFLLQVDPVGDSQPGDDRSAGREQPSVYVSGDSVDLDAMAELAARHRVDVALLHLGAAGFEELGPVRLSLTADQAVEAARRLGHAPVVAVHAEGWAHYTQGHGDYRRAFERAGLGPRLTWPAAGDLVALPSPGPAGERPAGGGGSPVELAASFYAAVDARPLDPERLRRHLDPRFRDRDRPGGFPAGMADRDVVVALLTSLAAAFPDGRHVLERLEPVGVDEALVCWRFTGTHTGAPFLGAVATGATVDFAGTDLFRAAGGRLAGQRHVEDLLTLTRQLEQHAARAEPVR